MNTPTPNACENEIWNPVREAVEQYCREILEDPMRSDYVKVRTAKKKIRTDDLPSMSDPQLQRYLGTVLTNASYTTKWGNETYKIEPELLLDETE